MSETVAAVMQASARERMSCRRRLGDECHAGVGLGTNGGNLLLRLEFTISIHTDLGFGVFKNQQYKFVGAVMRGDGL